MKSVKFLLLLWLSLATIVHGEISLGIVLGEPSGISIKLLQHKKMAYDISCSFNTRNDYLLLNFDFLRYDYNKISSKELTGQIPICYGLGISIDQNRHDTYLGLRIIGGIEYLFADIPINIFAKIAPVVNIYPSTAVHIAPCIGVRYIFK